MYKTLLQGFQFSGGVYSLEIGEGRLDTMHPVWYPGMPSLEGSRFCFLPLFFLLISQRSNLFIFLMIDNLVLTFIISPRYTFFPHYCAQSNSGFLSLSCLEDKLHLVFSSELYTSCPTWFLFQWSSAKVLYFEQWWDCSQHIAFSSVLAEFVCKYKKFYIPDISGEQMITHLF